MSKQEIYQLENRLKKINKDIGKIEIKIMQRRMDGEINPGQRGYLYLVYLAMLKDDRKKVLDNLYELMNKKK